jgi:hypothetical protein
LEEVPLTRATTDVALLKTWLQQDDASPHTRRAYERVGRRFLAAMPVPFRSATLEDMREAFRAIIFREDGAAAAKASAAAQTTIAKSFLSFGARVKY